MTSTITLDGADQAIEAGRAKAAQLGIAFTIAIVDAGTHLVALSRQDGAALASVESSQAKARTSVLFGAPPRTWQARSSRARRCSGSSPGSATPSPSPAAESRSPTPRAGSSAPSAWVAATRARTTRSPKRSSTLSDSPLDQPLLDRR